jgi:hypothetical protein
MRVVRAAALAVASAAAMTGAGLAAAPSALAHPLAHSPFIRHFHHIKRIASTVPVNGDVNPYGVAVVHSGQGRLRRGDVLVSNFNNKANLQGTGKTIVEIRPSGLRVTFAHISGSHLPGACPGGIGLTTALVEVHGWVIVGSLPSANGMAATSKAGCLLVLDSNGRVRETLSGHGINGPWDMTAVSKGHRSALFVTNVLNGTVAAGGHVVHGGTVLRLMVSFRRGHLPRLSSVTRIGSGFAEKTDPAAFVLAPTGVGFSHGWLYVADTEANRITAIPNALTRHTTAGTGKVVTRGGALNNPLGLAIAPNRDVLTVNGGDGRIVETTPAGAQVATRFLDLSGRPKGSGALFGLAVVPHGGGVYFVDDAVNTLRVLR